MSELTAYDCSLRATIASLRAKEENEQDLDGGWWQIGGKWRAMELFIEDDDWTPERDKQMDEMEAEVLALVKAHVSSSDQANKGV